MSNRFDDISIDVETLYKVVCLLPKEKYKKGFLPLNWLKLYFFGFLYFTGIYHKLLYSNIYTSWFPPFAIFWEKMLGGLKIDIIDFHFLRLNYKKKFQSLALDETSEESFLKTWQSRVSTHILFSWVWRYATFAYLNFYLFLKYLPKKGKILEYGAGFAPHTYSLIKYLPHRNYKFTIADLKYVGFLFGIYRIGKYENVEHVTFEPYRNTLSCENHFDAIICTEVLEHVPNPLEVVKSFAKNLKPGGVLIFDYLRGDGDGMDSKQSVKERSIAIEYIRDTFKVLSGTLKLDDHMGLTAVRKKL